MFDDRKNGFSLVELMMGMTVIIVLLAATVLTLQSLSRANKNVAKISVMNMALHSALDELREYAGQNFQTMEWSTPTFVNGQTLTNDRNVKVYSIVGPIDANRGRRITVTAEEYENGTLVRKESMDDYIQQPRVQAQGASIKVKAVRKNDGVGLAGVKITVLGQDGATSVTDYTDFFGLKTLSGVYLSQSGIPVTVDGQTVPPASGGRCYFDSPSPVAYAKTFATGQPTTSIGILDLTGTPYQLVCAGAVAGQIIDKNTSVGIANYQVLLYPNSIILPYSGEQQTATTDSTGHYSFTNVMPGKYGVYPTGEDVALTAMSHYPSLGEPNDNYQNNGYAGFITVSSFNTTTSNFKTLPSGSLQGAFRFATGFNLGSGKFTSTPVAANVSMLFQKTQTAGFFQGSPASNISTFSYSNSTAWLARINGESASSNLTFTSDGSGNYSTLGFLPRMAHKNDTTYPLASQYNTVFVLPLPGNSAGAAPESTPILVQYPNDLTNTPVFVIRYGNGSSNFTYRPLSASPVPNINNFAKNIFLNTTNNQDFYMLKKDQLCQIQGTVYSPSMPTKFFSMHAGGQTTVAITNGVKANVGAVILSGGKNIINPNFFAAVNTVNSTYDTGVKTVVPNLGLTDQTQIDFTWTSGPSAVTANLLGYTTCYTKDLVGNNIVRRIIIPVDLTIQSLNFYLAGNTSTIDFSVANVIPNNAAITLTNNPNFKKSDIYQGSALKTLIPATDYLIAGMPVDINVPGLPTNNSYQGYDVRPVVDNTGNTPAVPWAFTWTGNTMGPRYTYSTANIRYQATEPFLFNRILKENAIYGTVKNTNGAVVTGVNIVLRRSGYAGFQNGPDTGNPSQMATVANASCTGYPSNQQYCFQGHPFSAAAGNNFVLVWTDPTNTYKNGSEMREGYDLYASSWNVVLTLKNSSGGTSSGGNGGL